MPFPIDEILPQLITSLDRCTNLVLQAPPGAGKTTQVPLAILRQENWLEDKKIIMLEPRRIAARAAARFMAQSLGEEPGQTVGYRVRLDSRVGPKTRIEVVTEGILTRFLQDDPALEEYGIVIFDEFHERNLNTDLGLALCLDAQQGLREDLRLLVMSATLDGAAVSRLLGNAPILSSEGKSYPVDTLYHPVKKHFQRERREFLQEVTRSILKALKEQDGSILVFLPGAGEIRQVHEGLLASKLSDDIILAPLFGQLSSAEQDAAIKAPPENKRKVVLATSIAETSLTIDGIGVVIDSGLMRLPRFDPNTGLTRLVTIPVSQASADQRSGRAGRLQAGVCYRLWSEATHLLPQTNPEIVDADLSPLLLELALWGVSDVNDLSWLNAPPTAHIAQAKDLLSQLGAIDKQGMISPHGKAMAQWGVHPRLAHMILRSKENGAAKLGCEIAALLSERDILHGQAREADLRIRIDALHDHKKNNKFDQRSIQHVKTSAAQWHKQLDKNPSETKDQFDASLAGVLLAYAYPDRIAKRRGPNDTRYLLSNGSGARLDENDPLRMAEYIVAAHLDGSREARIFLATGIHREQLLEYHRERLTTHEFVEWDDKNACVQARKQQRIGQLVIEDELWDKATPEAVQAALLKGIRSRELSCLPWTDAARTLQARIMFLRQHDNDWPDFSDAALLETIDEWLSPYLDNMSRLSHLEKLDMNTILMSRLPWDKQSVLEELAPTHFTVPSGSNIRIDYSQSPPVLAVRLQEMFGLMDTPRIANGKVALILHLLSPAQRPVQVTQDLAGFWQSSYFEVKKDLKGRYPKHYWPDNPTEAIATRGIKRQRK